MSDAQEIVVSAEEEVIKELVDEVKWSDNVMFEGPWVALDGMDREHSEKYHLESAIVYHTGFNLCWVWKVIYWKEGYEDFVPEVKKTSFKGSESFSLVDAVNKVVKPDIDAPLSAYGRNCALRMQSYLKKIQEARAADNPARKVLMDALAKLDTV